MNPTKQIAQFLPLLQEPTDSGYRCFNTGGVETEVGTFLYGLVIATKPERILETGTHKGIGASYIGLALKENKKGLLDTIEFDPQHQQDYLDIWTKLEVLDHIVPHLMKVEDFEINFDYDIALLDTEPDIRFKELVRVFPHVKEGGFIIIHDLSNAMGQSGITAHGMTNWPFGEIPEIVQDWVKDDLLRVFHLPTPRGITIFYKTRVNDHRWR
jgi:predicted O-methyltransferase YrrM